MNSLRRQLFDDFAQDLRHALRGIRLSPGFAAAVIITLGLGLGANAAMFGVVDRLMFRPFAYLRDPSTVHHVYWRSWNRGALRTTFDSEYATYLDLTRYTTTFSHYAGFTHRMLAVGSGDASRERQVAIVSATFFDFFEAKPALGRFFAPAEDITPRGADVAVLAYAFWKAEFGGRDVRGEFLQVGNIAATIIGVASEGFVGLNDTDPPALFIPITTFAGAQQYRRNATTYFSAYYWRFMEIIVRRKPDVSIAQATADASQSAAKSWRQRSEIETDLPAIEVAKPSAVVSAVRIDGGPDPSLAARTALWVTGVGVIVLLIACANVANLFLARALKRRRETALRLALGVRRGRLVRQSVVESVLLSLLGSVAGLVVAQWGGAAIRRLLLTSPETSLDVFTDWRTLGVAIGLALVAGLLTGVIPSLLLGRGDLVLSLKTGAREGTYHPSRTRATLLVMQGALSVVLLVGAGLFVKSLSNVKAMPMGFDSERVLIATQNLRGIPLDEGALVQLRTILLKTAQALPGVESASWVMTVPLLATNATYLSVPGIDSVGRLGTFSYQSTTPDYFAVMGTRILRGRGITAEDRAGAPRVAVVSQSMARALWPSQDAIGQRMRIFADTMPWATVVGVAEDIVQREVAATERYHYYLSIEQFFPAGGLGLLLKTRGDPSTQGESVRRALQAEMPGQSYIAIRPLRELVDGARRSWQLGATMFAAFGALALVVAAVGLYGVIGYDVTQRMHELGRARGVRRQGG